MNKKRLIAGIVCGASILIFAVGNTLADSSVFEIKELQSPVSFHTEVQQALIDADYNNIKDFLPKEKEERSLPEGINISWVYLGTEVPEMFTVDVSQNEDMSDARVYYAAAESTDDQYSLNIQNLLLDTTYYYTVSDGENTSEIASFTVDNVAPRNLYIDGVTNARDIGGWVTNSGKKIKQGLLFRTGQINTQETQEACITENGIRTMLDELGIKTEIDLRKTEDNENGGITQSMLGKTVNYVSLPMDFNHMGDHEDSVKAFFELLADESNYPLFYHCKIGTDRTGFVTYLLYGILDVEIDSIYKDYVFSNMGYIDGSRMANRLDKGIKDIIRKNLRKDTALETSTAYLNSIGVSNETIASIVAILTED